MNTQDRTNAFLVAIVALVAVVGIVLQFSGAGSTDVDFSATGEAMRAGVSADKWQVANSKLKVAKLDLSMEEMQRSTSDESGEASRTDVGPVVYVVDESSFGEDDFDQEHYERQREFCYSCGNNARSKYVSCIEKVQSAALGCLDSAQGESTPAEIASAEGNCGMNYESAKIQCEFELRDDATRCRQDHSYDQYFQCLVKTDDLLE